MKLRRTGVFTTLAAACLVAAGLAAAASGVGRQSTGTAATATAGCQLGNKAGQIQHVIYLQFDNTHLSRDRPNVASDLEQMPNLLNFLTTNGTVFTNDHTILISHTGGGILSSLTGLYPNRSGMPVSNSYRYFKADGTTASSTSFKYWTDLVDDTAGTADPHFNMITDGQKNTPAPWVPFTRAGCSVGGVGTANIELENTGTGAFGDMTEVFQANSPEWNEAKATPAAAQTDFVGIAIHCATNGGLCAGNPNAKPDLLPDEPGGYSGLGLFGAKYVDPAITGGNACVTNTAGEAIADPRGQCGFPGFDGMLAKNTLGYVAQMQENGVPVTYGYISDAHDTHTPNTTTDAYVSAAQGPGEAGYVAQLKAYDDAFGAFFKNLADHGINKSNTLFVVTVDEGDHYAGGVSTDGTWSHTFCNVSGGQTCPTNQIGEDDLNLNSVLPSGEPPFLVHSDSSPTVYVTGNPGPTNPAVRKLERDVAAATTVDPYASSNPVPLTQALVDPIGENALHMVNTDPQRTPTFTLFANPDFFVSTFNTNCPDAAHSVASCVAPGFAWNHGDINPEIGNTWVGFVGPGVQSGGVDSSTWTDHTNVRPTILDLVGLTDGYGHDGFVLTQALDKKALPNSLFQHQKRTEQLGQVYEQLNASFGQFSHDVLAASTKALAGGSSTDDSQYTAIEAHLSDLTARRDALAAQIKAAFDGMAFSGQNVPDSQEQSWISQARSILAEADALAS
jgi:hypothetical protein